MTDPILVYDDDCGFCTWWATYFRDEFAVPIVGFSDLDEPLRHRLPEDYEDCAHLVTDEHVYSCGEALEEAFLQSDVGSPLRPLGELLRQSSLYPSLRELAYGVVADNRPLFSWYLSESPPDN